MRVPHRAAGVQPLRTREAVPAALTTASAQIGREGPSGKSDDAAWKRAVWYMHKRGLYTAQCMQRLAACNQWQPYDLLRCVVSEAMCLVNGWSRKHGSPRRCVRDRFRAATRRRRGLQFVGLGWARWLLICEGLELHGLGRANIEGDPKSRSLSDSIVMQVIGGGRAWGEQPLAVLSGCLRPHPDGPSHHRSSDARMSLPPRLVLVQRAMCRFSPFARFLTGDAAASCVHPSSYL